MKTISLKNLIVYYTLIVFFIPTMIVGFGSVGVVFYTSKKALIDNNNLILENISNIIEKKITQSLRDIEILEEFIENENPLNNENTDNLVDAILSKTNYFKSIYFYNKDGELIYTNPENKDIANLNYSDLYFIKKVINTKKFYFTNSLLPYKNNSLSLLMSYPVIRKNELIGIISVTIDLYEIEKTIELHKTRDKGLNIIILDDENNIVFYSDKSNFINISDILYSKTKNKLGLNTTYINKKKSVVFFKNEKNINWSIILTQELNTAFMAANILRFIIISYLIFGILICIAAVVLGYFYIFKPLVDLSYLTAKIAHSDYNIGFKKTNIKELNILTQNFSRMSKKILKKEKEIIDSELKYRKLIEDSLDFFFKISDKLRFTFMSPSIEKAVGYTIEEFTANFKNFLIYNKTNIKALSIAKNTFLTKEIPQPFIFEIVDKTNKTIILEIQLTPIIENNRVIEIQGSARDITLRYNVEKEVNYLKNYLYSIIESMPSAIITMNNNGIINQYNSAAKKMLECEDADIKGKILWEISSKFINYESYFQEALKQEEVLEFRDEIKFDNKETKFYNITFFCLNILKQKEVVLRIDDVTKIEKTEMQLRQAQKIEIIGTMAGGLAHDFNNILGAIVGTLTLIEYRAKNKKTISYKTLQDDLNTIKEASSKATGIVQQLMTLSRKQSIKTETIDLNEEIKQVVNICKTSFNKLLKIEINYYKEPAWIEGNSGQIEQMILNLLVNARDAVKNEGFIEITLDKIISDKTIPPKKVVNENLEFYHLTISDNGNGIPNEYKEQIFDPFFTTKEKGKGTGLGLTMVYNIVKLHKGYIDFDSEINKGTSFSIFLPVKNIHKIPDNKEKNKPQIIKGSGLILIVDDEEYIRYTAKEILKECGYEVLIAKDGEEGVKIFKENYKNISGVLLDMVMPNKIGKEAYIDMKKIDKNVKVLLSSAVKTDPRISETMQLGVKYFLLKPYSFEELSQAIYMLINSK